MTRTCLDLFAGLGGFSAAFADSDDWDVTTVEIDPEFDPDIVADVMDLRPADLPEADVVLASPPCTLFSMARVQWEKSFDTDGVPHHDAAREAVALVWHTKGLIHAADPDYWFTENPQGYLRHVIGEPEATVDYCAYGHYTKKPTDLWGTHPPMTYRRCSHNGHTDENGISDFERGASNPTKRAKVPWELSEAIREAVDEAYQNPPPEQTELPGVATSGGER